MDQIAASAPGKLMLYGEHAVVYGYPCIVTAVNQRMYVSVKKNGKNTFRMDAPDLGLTAYSKTISDLGTKDSPKAVQFVEMLYKRFLNAYPQDRGIDVQTKSDFSSQFGFGSSSAVTVAFAKALTKLYDLELSNKELFDLCYQAVIDVQGVGSGFDIASAIWGRTIYYVPPAKVVRDLKLTELPLMVCYTGIKADTPTLVRMVQQQRDENEAAVDAVFKEMEEIAVEAEKKLVDKDWKRAGELMNINHELLRSLKVSGVELERLVKTARKAGAYGAKLSGAGGGDCMIALVSDEQENRVDKALVKAKGQVLPVKLNAQGVRYEKSDV